TAVETHLNLYLRQSLPTWVQKYAIIRQKEMLCSQKAYAQQPNRYPPKLNALPEYGAIHRNSFGKWIGVAIDQHGKFKPAQNFVRIVLAFEIEFFVPFFLHFRIYFLPAKSQNFDEC